MMVVVLTEKEITEEKWLGKENKDYTCNSSKYWIYAIRVVWYLSHITSKYIFSIMTTTLFDITGNKWIWSSESFPKNRLFLDL